MRGLMRFITANGPAAAPTTSFAASSISPVVAHAVVERPDGLVGVGAEEAVDREAVAVLAAQRLLAARGAERQRQLDRALVGRLALHDLDDRVDGGRAEIVQAEEAARLGQVGGEIADPEAARVGRHQAVERQDRAQALEQARLDAEVLEHGLDHEVRVGQILERAADRDPAGSRPRRPPAASGPCRRCGCRTSWPGPAPGRRLGAGVDQPHPEAVLRQVGGDARPHRAGADDADALDIRHAQGPPRLRGRRRPPRSRWIVRRRRGVNPRGDVLG